MGMCHSLRSRLLGPRSAISYTSARTANPGPDGESGQPDSSDPQLREQRRVAEKARLKADKKRSKDIDKTLNNEKRQYKQTHRLLLLGKLRGKVALHKVGSSSPLGTQCSALSAALLPHLRWNVWAEVTNCE